MPEFQDADKPWESALDLTAQDLSLGEHMETAAGRVHSLGTDVDPVWASQCMLGFCCQRHCLPWERQQGWQRLSSSLGEAAAGLHLLSSILSTCKRSQEEMLS